MSALSFRFVTAGESLGPGLTAVVEGLPAGLELDRDAWARGVERASGWIPELSALDF